MLAHFFPVDQARPAQGDTGQLGPVGSVGSVAAEGEESVEVRPVQLDVGSGFDVPGDQPEEIALFDKAGQ
jgi:hypothetical protein